MDEPRLSLCPPPQRPEAGELYRLHAELCAALADPRRMMILYALAQGERGVNDIAEAVCIPQPAASRHLKVLRDAGLVQPTRQGASIHYRLTDPRLIQALDLLRLVLQARLAHNARLVVHSTPNLSLQESV